MARKFLYLIAVLVVLVIVALAALRLWSLELTRFAFVPRSGFEQKGPLPDGAYKAPGMWFSRPGIANDPAQLRPQGMKAEGDRSRAVVFFVHPTSYLARDHWNGSLEDADANRRAASFIRAMGSAFNGAAQVWAPRYRQATFGAFLTDKPESAQALAVAYQDVKAAFASFLQQVPADAPIILAGHSQGSLHLIHLLRDSVKGTPIQQRLIATYAIGWPISARHDLPAMGLPACAGPEDTGCAISWETFAEPAEPALVLDAFHGRTGLDGQRVGNEAPLCTNPLTGRMGGGAPIAANLGTLQMDEDPTGGKLISGAAPARCDERGLLLIGDPPSVGPYVLPGNNYHVYDIPLFWMNLRADVARRTAAWEKSHSVPTP
ncbi:DUF3089 domain-containing protein [Novosphingobium sp.]|uniref:DUF3089 domain-containing protein n=1 Tax=Novosphingobium sp. TaxID=1874826 RepID=UPI00352B50A2